VYFLEFCERIARHGLRYLGEAEFSVMVAGTAFPPEVQDVLEEFAPNLIEKEQYMDFLRNRTFRQSLVCHADQQPCYDVRAEHLLDFHIASPVKPVSSALDLTSEKPETFRNPEGVSLTTSTPIVKAALVLLAEVWPRAIPFAELRTRVRDRMAVPAEQSDDAMSLARALLTAYATPGSQLVELSLRPPTFTTIVSDRPLASPLARRQARTNRTVTNLRHRSTTLTSFDSTLLILLDGTRDHDALLDGLVEKFIANAFQIRRQEELLTDPAVARPLLQDALVQRLPWLAEAALLLA
jgi:methyltransferase-like protein